MLRAIGRLFGAIWSILTGRVDNQSRKLERNTDAVGHNYAQMIRDKIDDINKMTLATSTLMAEQEKKHASIKKESAEVQRLQRAKAGAGLKAKERASDLKAQGKTPEEIAADSILTQCRSSYNDFSSTLAEKEKRIADLEQGANDLQGRIDSHSQSIIRMQREKDELRSECADTQADLISAEATINANKITAGISADRNAQKLEEMRNMRQQVKAEEKIAGKLAGTDSRKLMDDYENCAMASAANDEFDKLLGLEPADDKLASLEQKLEALKSKEAIPAS
jgi:hypothetical protein